MSAGSRGLVVVTLLNAGAHIFLREQVSWLPAPPDLLLLFLVFVNMYFAGVGGLALAFASGLFQDFLLGTPPGGHPIAYLVSGYAISRLFGGRRKPSAGEFVAAGIAASMASASIYRAISTPPWDTPGYGKVLLFSLYNGLFALAAFPAYRKCLKTRDRLDG